MGKPEAPPPSYDEAVSSPVGPPPQQFQAPPQPPRPQNSSFQSQAQGPPGPSPGGFPRPQGPPNGYSNGYPSNFQQNQGPGQMNGFPWRYPSGYWCSKCHNTGKKLKNGKSCQKCWERFAPRTGRASNVHLQTVYNGSSNSNYGGFQLPFANSGSYTTTTSSFTNAGPRYVQPGDPAIGGIQCGKCRGRGMVRFLLDEEHCPVCNGIGRIFV